jgi:predicted small lipoprotein YifL
MDGVEQSKGHVRMNRSRWLRCVWAGSALMATAGCGQKGALYLPEHNGRVITRPATTPAAQAPATQAPAGTPSSDPKKDADRSDGSPPTR